MKGEDARRAIHKLNVRENAWKRRYDCAIERIEERVRKIQSQCEHTRRNPKYGECLDCGFE